MPRQLRFDFGPCLFFGDNLDILPAYIADETVDLVYLDPPFNSQRSYNAIFRRVDGAPVPAQIKAFDDTWQWSLESEIAFRRIVERGGELSRVMLGFREILGTSEMLAYLTMMAPRLIELHRVLKLSGSLYLHCDPTASHYLKIVLDSVFGPTRFRNEIIWKRTYAHGNAGRNFANVSDRLLLYSKGPKYQWNTVFVPMEPDYVRRRFSGVDPDGRRWQSVTLRNPSPRPNLRYIYAASNGIRYKPHHNGWSVSPERMEKYDRENRLHFPARKDGQLRLKMYEDESPGVRATNLWDDIYPINSQAQERLGYPTQKPLALLGRIIAASTKPGDVVLDPFCGCGTAIEAAQALGRQWIGIDITKVAIEVIQKRLANTYPLVDYSIRGIPVTMDEVDFLADRDKYAFQQWVCDRLGIDADVRKGADRGIDGELVKYNLQGRPWRAVVSVKGGGVNVTQVRDLRGTVEREQADTGIFVTRKQPTKPMRDEALASGLTAEDIPKIQILTAADLLAGRGPRVPSTVTLPTRPVEAVAEVERPVVPKHRRVPPSAQSA